MLKNNENLDMNSLILDISRLEIILEKEGLSKNLAQKIRYTANKVSNLRISSTKEKVIKGFLKYLIEGRANLTSPHSTVKGTARNYVIKEICKILNELQSDPDYLGRFQNKYSIEYGQDK